MKIGIISDTHDHLRNIKKSVTIFKEKKVDHVLHLGDFINPNSVRAFRGIDLVGVFGNNDGDRFRLSAAFNEIKGTITGDFYEFVADSLKFACYHGTEPQITDALISCGKYDVVLFGHTHQAVRRTEGKTLVLNPGTAHGFFDKATIMIFDTVSQESELLEL